MSTLPPTVNSQHPRALLFRNAAEVLRLIKGVHRFSKGGFGESMGIAHANIIHACAKNRVVESVHTGIGNPLEPRGTPAGERVSAFSFQKTRRKATRRRNPTRKRSGTEGSEGSAAR